MNPASNKAAGRQAAELIRRHFRGATVTTKRRRYKTAALIGDRIWCRWQVGVYRWQQKHIRWYLVHCLQDCSNNTRYQHFLVARDLVKILGREQWLAQLNGPWLRPSGHSGSLKSGRPPVIRKARSE